MIEHQEHFGRLFYKDHKTGYWISTDYPRIRAHRWVWENYFGKIPKKLHIHHKDFDKSNNLIENLTIMSCSDHIKLHFDSDNDRMRKQRIHISNVRPLTKKWHASVEGRTWHKLHALKGKFGNWEAKEYNCEECGNVYQSKKRSNSKFCSNACKSKWRRKQGIDNIEKTCPVCNNTYITNRYSRSKTCSRICGKNIGK